MNYSNTTSIALILLSTKESNTTNHSKTGYNVFISRFFLDVQEAGNERIREMLQEFGIHSEKAYEMHEKDDCYSLPPITSIDVMKLTGKYWRGLDKIIRDGWKLRADTINRLPPYGAFSEVPTSVTSDTIMY